MNSFKNLYKKYLLDTYKREGSAFVKGKGSWLWNEKGKCFLDLFPGWGVSILGHCHPQIIKVIKEQSQRLIHLPNNLYHKEQVLLAKEIVKNAFSSKVFFANSGAEAVEAAIKFSRLYGKGKRFEIITMKNSFHGRTFGALSATGQKKYKNFFKPLLPKFKETRLNDFDDFKRKISSKTVGVILELIQGEGGINIVNKDYVKKVRDYCQRYDMLFIVDEIQTGMGRTSKLFCYQHYGIIPDIMLLSKGLGAGFPVSAILIKKEIADIIKPGMHASTFGGSPLASRVAYEVFKIIKKEKILENVKKQGEYLKEKLEEFKNKFSFVKEIRGMGLMVGIELKFDAYPVFLQCLEKRLIINSTHKTVLRIMPALNVKREELDKGLDILEKVFKRYK